MHYFIGVYLKNEDNYCLYESLSPTFKDADAAVESLKEDFNNAIGPLIFEDDDAETLDSYVSDAKESDHEMKDVYNNEMKEGNSWWHLNDNHKTMAECDVFMHDTMSSSTDCFFVFHYVND